MDDATKLAQACAEAMWTRDSASRGLGMSLDAVGPGTAQLSMTVRDDMVNGHEICHGGFIFTLADSAFAFACNAYDEITVAASADISFLAPGKLGEKLTARANEVYRKGRSGIYDIEVVAADGRVIAQFRGKSRTIGGRITKQD